MTLEEYELVAVKKSASLLSLPLELPQLLTDNSAIPGNGAASR